MQISIKNIYHDTVKIVEASSLEKAKRQEESALEVTAERLAIDDLEADWKEYYSTKEEALEVSYKMILAQLKNELEYSILKEED